MASTTPLREEILPPEGPDAELVDLIGESHDAGDRAAAVAGRLRKRYGSGSVQECGDCDDERSQRGHGRKRRCRHPAQYLGVRSPARIRQVMELWGGERRLAQYPLEEPVPLSDVSDRAEWDRIEYIRLFAIPQGIGRLGRHSPGQGREDDRQHFVRHSFFPPFGIARGSVVAEGDVPPTSGAPYRSAAFFDDATAAAASFSAVLDATSSGVVIVDGDGRILHANAAAQPMLAAGDPIREAGGRLHLREELVPGQLMAAIRARPMRPRLEDVASGYPRAAWTVRR